MLKTLKKERRLNQRIEHRLPVNVAANGYEFSTTTHNISCAGAYCQINKYLPPFTKVAVRLHLPLFDRKNISSPSVDCKGVVVRSEDNHNGGFNIAIFFNEIRQNQRQRISQYIREILSQNSVSLSQQ